MAGLQLHANSCNLFRFRSEAGESAWALPLLRAAKPGEAAAREEVVRAPGDALLFLKQRKSQAEW